MALSRGTNQWPCLQLSEPDSFRTTLDKRDNYHDDIWDHLHLLNLFLGGQLLLQVGGLAGEDGVELGTEPRHGQSPAEVEIAENFLLQLQLRLGVLSGEVDGEVEADVVRVREQGDLETAE